MPELTLDDTLVTARAEFYRLALKQALELIDPRARDQIGLVQRADPLRPHLDGMHLHAVGKTGDGRTVWATVRLGSRAQVHAPIVAFVAVEVADDVKGEPLVWSALTTAGEIAADIARYINAMAGYPNEAPQ